MTEEEGRLLEQEERHRLLVRLRLLDARLVRHQAAVDVTEEEAADMRLDRLRRVVDATEEHLTEVIEAERMLGYRVTPPSRHR